MHFWSYESVVSKEAFVWRCINFSDFFQFLEKVFWLQFTTNRSIDNSCTYLFFVTPDSRCEGNIPSFSWITLSFKFFGTIIRKCFPKRVKIAKINATSENCFFGNKSQVISKGHWMAAQAYLIKWTTSGEPFP